MKNHIWKLDGRRALGRAVKQATRLLSVPIHPHVCAMRRYSLILFRFSKATRHTAVTLSLCHKRHTAYRLHMKYDYTNLSNERSQTSLYRIVAYLDGRSRRRNKNTSSARCTIKSRSLSAPPSTWFFFEQAGTAEQTASETSIALGL